jgi:hypothetical protein
VRERCSTEILIPPERRVRGILLRRRRSFLWCGSFDPAMMGGALIPLVSPFLSQSHSQTSAKREETETGYLVMCTGLVGTTFIFFFFFFFCKTSIVPAHMMLPTIVPTHDRSIRLITQGWDQHSDQFLSYLFLANSRRKTN